MLFRLSDRRNVEKAKVAKSSKLRNQCRSALLSHVFAFYHLCGGLKLRYHTRTEIQEKMIVRSEYLAGIDARSAQVLKEIVEQYLRSGDPVGSLTLSHRLTPSLSPATIRNVMAELTRAGLLSSPHISAGRVPTEKGVKLFVDGLLEFGSLTKDEQRIIATRLSLEGRSYDDLMADASALLAGLSKAAGVVFAPKSDVAIRHIEFVAYGPSRALVILVGADGRVENRIVETPPDIPASALAEASKYLNARIGDVTMSGLRRRVRNEMQACQQELNQLAAQVVEAGLAYWDDHQGTLHLRGQAALLEDINEMAHLSTIRRLFETLETQEMMLKLLHSAQDSDGVRIYVGAESELFDLSGVSMIFAPARNKNNRIVGAIGVIGPTRLDYGRVVPVVDYTAKILGHILD